jgi:hypothetical protein
MADALPVSLNTSRIVLRGHWPATHVRSDYIPVVSHIVVNDHATIVLKKDCLACPVVSPYGSLTNNSDATSYLGRDSTIIWKTPHLEDEERCKLKRVNSATGIVTKIGEGSLKLVDESNQLEFHYKEKHYYFVTALFTN